MDSRLMQLLQINSSDSFGSRFNGIALHERLAQRGVESRHLVRTQLLAKPWVEPLYTFPFNSWLIDGIKGLERRLSVQSMLHLQSFLLMSHPRFRQADVIHYHIIHDGYFSLAALPMLSKAKPTVWTFHDPWAMTGHCIYPLDCTRWQSGCGGCPDLHIPLQLQEDRTHLNWRYKKGVYSQVNADVIVASRWMRDFVGRSPLTRGFRFHVVPFGLDLDRFSPAPAHPIRERLGIFPDHTVIALRADNGPFKGLTHFKEALRQLDAVRPVCILTTQLEGVLDEFIGKFQIVELGWINDENLIAEFHQAADFFVMPSVAEAFGLMAVEAMACGKPVICFEGTSLPDVTFAPSVGLAVPMGDSAALAAALDGWIQNPGEVRMRGERARQFAVDHYSLDLHLDRLITVYEQAVERHQGRLPQ